VIYVSPGEVVLAKPGTEPRNCEPFFPLVTAKCENSQHCFMLHWLFLPSVTKDVQNYVPVLAGKLSISSWDSEILNKTFLLKCSKWLFAYILYIFCCIICWQNLIFKCTVQIQTTQIQI